MTNDICASGGSAQDALSAMNCNHTLLEAKKYLEAADPMHIRHHAVP